MLNSFKLKICQLLIVFFVFTVASCNEEKSNSDGTALNNESGNTDPSSTTEVALLVSGKLDSLWVDSTAFAALPNRKLVMSFVFGENDTLTLHGWSQNNGAKEFDSLPNMKLKKGIASKLTYGNGTYFGNISLKQNDINQIQNALRDNKAQYVVFAPQKYGNNIGYKIYVGTENPATLIKILGVTDTGTEANPSPPKNY